MIHVLMGFCNAEPYLARAIQSLQLQQFKEWTCHLLDDASTDGSIEIALQVSDSRFVYHRKENRQYLNKNYHEVISTLDDNDICITVDGDDYLPDSGVFSRINEVYQDDIWVTWGSCLLTTCKGSYVVDQQPLLEPEKLREFPWVPFHLRTWKAFLWKKIKEEDLKDDEGNWLTVAGDLAYMYPMVEMAGIRHSRFLPQINYIYNYDNPLSNHHTNRERQLGNDQLIRSRPTYCFQRMYL